MIGIQTQKYKKKGWKTMKPPFLKHTHLQNSFIKPILIY